MTTRILGNELHFDTPWALLLLAAVALAFVLELRRETARPAGVLFSSLALLPRGHRSWRVRARWLLLPVRVLGLCALVVALASPTVVRAAYEVPAEGIDIVVALDTSSSMGGLDFGGESRMDATKRVLLDFLGGLKNDRVGVVVFSAESMVLSPLTLDYDATERLVAPIRPGQRLRDGTAIGVGLATAVNALRPSTARSRVIILLTDGQNNAGDIQPLDAAQIAKLLGMRVYTIGAISSGQSTSTEVDEALMRQMSALTGGQYYRASNATTLRDVYAEISTLERARVGSRGFIETVDASLPFIAAGLALLVLELLLATTVFRRMP
jgi:Ca-activated chloride channel family protein